MQKHINYRINQEIVKLTKLSESIESWLTQNLGHIDYEKVNRQRNNIEIKIKARKQEIERDEYPARFNFKQEVSLPKFTL